MLESIPWAEKIASACGLPLIGTVAEACLADDLGHIPGMFFIENATKKLY